MRKLRARATVVLALILTLQSTAYAFVEHYLRNVPPITFVNLDPNSQIYVRSFEAGNSSEFLSCQTLGWSNEGTRKIEPWKTSDELWWVLDHCGEYDQLWFRIWVYNSVTGTTREFSTWSQPARWGASWTWDGGRWWCEGTCH